MDIGICWDAGYIGICGIGGDMWDMRRYAEICGIGGEDGGYVEIWGICGDMGDMWRYAEICGDMRRYVGRTTSPKSARPGCRFLDQPPPIHEVRETGTANDLRAEKIMLILYLTC